MKQRRLNKASPHFEPVPYSVLDVKGSMITGRLATDQNEVTRNSSHFKKLIIHQEVPNLTPNQYLSMSKCHFTSKERRSVNLPRPQHPKRDLVRQPKRN